MDFRLRLKRFHLEPEIARSADQRIGVGRFRILGGGGGQGLEFWGGQGEAGGGANSQQAHDVVTTSMRRNDVASTSFRRRVPIRFFIQSVSNNYISHLKI